MAESSAQGAGGPAARRPRCLRTDTTLASAGGIAMHHPYHTGSETPAAASTRHGANRMNASAASTIPYGPKRAFPESVPRVRLWNEDAKSATTRHTTRPALPAKSRSTTSS